MHHSETCFLGLPGTVLPGEMRCPMDSSRCSHSTNDEDISAPKTISQGESLGVSHCPMKTACWYLAPWDHG